MTLAAYSRFMDATAEQFESIFEAVTGLNVRLTSDWHFRKRSNRFSSLNVEGGQFSVVVSRDPLSLKITNRAEPALLCLSPGTFLVCSKHQSHGVPLELPSETPLIVLTFPDPAPGLTAARQVHISHKLEALISNYLRRSECWPDHRKAQRDTQLLFDRVNDVLVGHAIDSEPDKLFSLDRRVLTVINWIHNNPDWHYDIEELASIAHLGERTLYKLMTRNLGQTPYAYFRRVRLLTARDCILREPAVVRPLISRCALDHGFAHLSRFSAQYKHHFGELPRDTLQTRKHLAELYRAIAASPAGSSECG